MKKLFIVLILILYCSNLWGDDNFSIALNPEYSIPLYVYEQWQSMDFRPYGVGTTLSFENNFKSLPFLYALGQVSYLLPKIEGVNRWHLLSLSGGLGGEFRPGSFFHLKAALSGGVFWGFTNIVESSLFSSVLVEGNFQINPIVHLGLGLKNQNYYLLSSDPGVPLFLYSGLSLSLGITIHPFAKIHKPALRIGEIILDPYFPALYKYYDTNAVGKVSITNEEDQPIEDVKVSFYVPGLMENPLQCVSIKRMEVLEEREIPISPLLSSNVLQTVEISRVPVYLYVDYLYKGSDVRAENSGSLQILNRNAISWRDAKQASLFVTSRDSDVMRFSQYVVRAMDDISIKSIDSNFLVAMGLMEALSIYDMTYVKDPSTVKIEFGEHTELVDFLAFPRETLERQAGDCDDLAVCYAALLEAVGIETAFISTPGHLFTAFALKQSPVEAEELFRNTSSFIVTEGRVWIPLETTLMNKGFLKSWDQGARAWRENFREGKAEFYTTREGREAYDEPVLPLLDAGKISPPAQFLIIEAVETQYKSFVNREIGPVINRIKESDLYASNDPAQVNRLAAFLAGYGLLDEAEKELSKLAGLESYFPLLYNMAYLYYLKSDWSRSMEWALKAQKMRPENNKVRDLLENLSTEMGLLLYDSISSRDMERLTEEEVHSLMNKSRHDGRPENNPSFWMYEDIQ